MVFLHAGPVGPVLLSDPLGPSRMPSLDDLHQPLTVDPWDTDGIYAVDASDWLTAGGPHTVDTPGWPTAGELVTRLHSSDPMGPSGMLLLDGYNQPPTVGKPSRPRPGDQPESIADCGQTIQLRGESEDTNKVPDPVTQTGSDADLADFSDGDSESSVELQTEPWRL